MIIKKTFRRQDNNKTYKIYRHLSRSNPSLLGGEGGGGNCVALVAQREFDLEAISLFKCIFILYSVYLKG
jgi:hypothetical protein